MLSAASEDGRLRIRPERITSSGDVLTASDPRLHRPGVGEVDPHDYYCSTEAPYIAWECDAHDGLHINADYVLVESVDTGGRPVPPETLGGKLLLTNLSNRIMPLLRYEMSDQVEFLDGPWPLRLPSTARPQGGGPCGTHPLLSPASPRRAAAPPWSPSTSMTSWAASTAWRITRSSRKGRRGSR